MASDSSAHYSAAKSGSGIDTTMPHSARIWNYWLGGKDNYPVDREVGDHIAEMMPQIVDIAREVRAFLYRAVRYLTVEAGIRQFLDVGTGLPTADNTHEVAQRYAPESRIVYVDHDPLVLTFARALLTSSSEGACDYIDADLRDPDRILRDAAQTLDLAKPTALMLLGITAHITDDEEAYAIVDDLMGALSPGSYLVLSDDTEIIEPDAMRQAVALWNEMSDNPRVTRSPEQFSRFFRGLDVMEPGLGLTVHWRPEQPPAREVDNFGGVGRKKG